MHQVSQEADFQTLTGPQGALEGVLGAREAGLIRHIGVTSHNQEMALKLIKTGLFGTIQFPFNFIEDWATKGNSSPRLGKRILGILAMKPFGGGLIDNAGVAFKFLRQFANVVPLPGCDSVARVDEVADFYEAENVVSSEDLAAMERYRAELGQDFCRRCEYCQPCPQGVMITPAMLYGVVAHRMGPAKAAGRGNIMESVKNCIACGECAERCPYGLPISDRIKEFLALYDQHRQPGKGEKIIIQAISKLHFI